MISCPLDKAVLKFTRLLILFITQSTKTAAEIKMKTTMLVLKTTRDMRIDNNNNNNVNFVECVFDDTSSIFDDNKNGPT